MAFEIAAAALIALVVWRASKRWPMPEENRATKWRFAPLAVSGVILALTIVTFGAGVFLAPVAVLATVLSARRLAPPRGPAYWLGATLSGVLSLVFVILLTAIFVEVARGT